MEQNKYQVTFTLRGENRWIQVDEETSLDAELKVKNVWPEAENVYARNMVGVLDDKIRASIQKVKFSENVEADPIRKAQCEERLRACADAAYMFGLESQESLARTLDRLVHYEHEITGLDGQMFSFGFRSTAGYYGGILFHCYTKEWSAHT